MVPLMVPVFFILENGKGCKKEFDPIEVFISPSLLI